jgi:hypothetical protein
MRFTALTVGLALLLLAGLAGAAAAQTAWVPGRYSSLKEESNARLLEAEALGAGSPRRGALVLEAVRLRQEAAAMLREALRGGVIVEEQSAQARDEYAVLETSIVERLMELARCDEARAQLTVVLSDPLILPPGALAELEALGADVEQCPRRARWDGEGPGTIAAASERVAEAQSSADALASAPGQDGATEEPVLESTPVPPRDDGGAERLVPWVLIGVGGALGVAALGYDVSLGAARDELDALRTTCAAGCSEDDLRRGRQLSDDLDGARWVVAGLAGAGLVAGTVALVLLLTSDEEPESAPLGVVPHGPGDLGASVRVRF